MSTSSDGPSNGAKQHYGSLDKALEITCGATAVTLTKLLYTSLIFPTPTNDIRKVDYMCNKQSCNTLKIKAK